MRWEIYTRVSTDDQNVEQQAKYTKDWAFKNDLDVFRITLDKESARLPLVERKQFSRLLKRCELNKRGVLIFNLDRLTRNWDDVTYIEKVFRDNWDFMPLMSTSDSIDLSNASGRMMFRIRMAVCCYMPEDMREKQVIGIARAKAEGGYNGRKLGAFGKKDLSSGEIKLINEMFIDGFDVKYISTNLKINKGQVKEVVNDEKKIKA